MTFLPKQKDAIWVAVIGIAILTAFILYALATGANAFIADNLLFILLTIILALSSDRWRLTTPTFISIIVAFTLHSAGVFGWYNISPLPIAWERITHFFGIMPVTFLLYSYLHPFFSKKCWTPQNARLFLIILTASLGLATLIELSEFYGYLALGLGEGMFLFGYGDSIAGKTGQELIDVLGGGWINQSWDLTIDLLGAIAALTFMIASHYAFKKR